MIKKSMLISLVTVTALLSVGCSKGTSAKKSSGVEKLVSEYGFQWKDTSKPILNKKRFGSIILQHLFFKKCICFGLQRHACNAEFI